MKKIIFFLFLSLSLLKADYFYSSMNQCISDFYFQDSKFYFQLSSNSNWYYTSEFNQYETLAPGFTYDVNSTQCTISKKAIALSLKPSQYMFLLSLTGLLVGFTWLFGFSLIMSRKGSGE